MAVWNRRRSIEVILAAQSGSVPKKALGQPQPVLQAKGQEVLA